jgi:hypothetical protein
MAADADDADNEKMDEQEKQAYTNFVKNAWARAMNLAKGQQLDNADYVLLKNKTNSYSHTQSQFFYRHMFNSHSDADTEAKQGQIAIQETDFGFIPGIIESPTFKIEGIKYKGDNCVLYGQTTKNGNTYIYIERVSSKRHRYSAVTFYNINKTTDANYPLKKMANNAFYDLANIVMINSAGGGGNPTGTAGATPSGAAANSANPDDTLLSRNPAPKSSP